MQATLVHYTYSGKYSVIENNVSTHIVLMNVMYRPKE